MQRTLLTITVATALALAAVVACLIWSTAIENVIGKDTFQKTYGFLLVVVIGGALSLVYKEYERGRQEQIQDLALRREFYDSLIVAYNDAKRIRRLIRARALTMPADDTASGPLVCFAAYDEYMQQLNDVQLSIELMLRQAQGDSVLYGAASDLEKNLTRMKTYLREVGREYELHLHDFTGEPPTLSLSKLELLKKFIGSTSGEVTGHFWQGYVEPAYGAISATQTLLRS